MRIINPIRPQFVPVAWGGFCLFAAGIGIQKLFEFSYLSAGWQGGIGLIGMAIFGFLAIEGWWLASQCEIRPTDDLLQIRSWLKVVLGRRGDLISWTAIEGAGLIFDRGRRLEVRTRERRFRYWAALWHPAEVNRLVEIFRLRSVPISIAWDRSSFTG